MSIFHATLLDGTAVRRSIKPGIYLAFGTAGTHNPTDTDGACRQGNPMRRRASVVGPLRRILRCKRMSASLIGHLGSSTFRLSAAAVSMSLAGSRFSSESAQRALPSWDSRTRWNNLSGGLAVRLTVGPSRHAISPHPSSREGHHSTARWSSSFLLLDLILFGFHAAAATCSRVQRNSVPSPQMRCRITANRRARATIAFFIPRRLAICIAHALSQDHFFERSML